MYSNETGGTEYHEDKSKFAEDQHLQIVTSEFESNIKPSKSKMRSNQTLLLDNQSSLASLKSFAIGHDPFKSCNTNGKCTDALSTGSNDKRSLRNSTANNINNTWSSFIGSEIDVKPEDNTIITFKLTLQINYPSMHCSLRTC